MGAQLLESISCVKKMKIIILSISLDSQFPDTLTILEKIPYTRRTV